MYVDAERRLTAIPSKSGGGNGGKRDKKRSTERAGAESACSQFRIEEAYAYQISVLVVSTLVQQGFHSRSCDVQTISSHFFLSVYDLL
jgi:hypothetical protein